MGSQAAKGFPSGSRLGAALVVLQTGTRSQRSKDPASAFIMALCLACLLLVFSNAVAGCFLGVVTGLDQPTRS